MAWTKRKSTVDGDNDGDLSFDDVAIVFDFDCGFRYDAKSRLVCTGVCVFDEERYLAGDYGDYNELYSFEPVVSNCYDHLDRRVQKITPAPVRQVERAPDS